MTQTIDPARVMGLTRVYRAPRDLILQMWSEPDRITKWWGPIGFTTTTTEMDFRPGGVWRFTMHGPDGTDFPNFVKYIETGPDRIVYDHGCDGEVVHFHVVVTLDEIDSGMTKMDFQAIFPTVEALRRVVEEFGAEKGMIETTARLDALLAETQSAADPFRLVVSLPSDTEIQMVRSFRAPRSLVFEAFTKAEHIRNWQSPHQYTFVDCEFDARLGGKWHMSQSDTDGNVWRFQGDVLEVSPPAKLVATFACVGMPWDPLVNTTTFDEIDGVTRVTTTSSFKTKADRDGMLDSGMEWGLGQSYERLEALLASSLESR